MKRTLLLIAIIAALLLITFAIVRSSKAAGTLEILQSMRWASMSIMDIDVTGTRQISTAFVDSAIGWSEQTIGTDPTLLHLMATDTQTVTGIYTGADTLRTQFYTMNANFLPNGLTGVMYRPFGAKSFYRISATLPPISATPPGEKDAPAYAWTEGNVLLIQPAPRKQDQFFLTYRALPDKMTSSADTTGIAPTLRRMVIVLAAADIAKRLNLIGRELGLRAEYAALKSELLILPVAALSGGDNR